jgi:NADPH2:quinone reductase
MRALVVETLAPDYAGCVLKDLPTREPGPGEARLKVRAASINFPDLLMTRGEYQHKPALPFVGGLEMTGEVEAVGEGVEDWRPGDAVVCGGAGGFAEEAIVRAASLRRKPERMSFSEAAAYGAAYLTAFVALVWRAKAKPDEWVLVHGAAGGVGLACVDMAKSLGLKVIAASASDAKLAVVQAEYAPDAILNITGGFREKVKALTHGRGADIIYDPVGGDVFDESTRCIAFDGRLLVVGFTSGRIATIPTNIPLIKGFSVVGVRAGEYGRQFPDRGAENLNAIWAMAEDGQTRPRVHAELPLAHWREAFALLENREVIGKAVIRPDL